MSHHDNDGIVDISWIGCGVDSLDAKDQPTLDRLSDDEKLIIGHLIIGTPPNGIAAVSELAEDEVATGLDSIFALFRISPEAEDKPAAALEVFTRLAVEERTRREDAKSTPRVEQGHIITHKKHLKRLK